MRYVSNEVILIAYPDQSEQEYLELKVGYNKDFNMNNLFIDKQAHKSNQHNINAYPYSSHRQFYRQKDNNNYVLSSSMIKI